MIAYALTPEKDERLAINLLISLQGCFGIWILSYLNFLALPTPYMQALGRVASQDSRASDVQPVLHQDPIAAESSEPDIKESKHKRWALAVTRYLNRFLRIIHATISVLFVVGAITMALNFRFENP
jgi:hypothetical protein